jgi:hypothetical protein
VSVVYSRVRRFRLNFFFASKRNEAKRDSFRLVFACSSENKEPIFSLVFASFRFKFFVSLRSEKKKQNFSLRFASNFNFVSKFKEIIGIFATAKFVQISSAGDNRVHSWNL